MVFILLTIKANANSPHYAPEIMLGHRSITFQHLLKYSFNNRFSFNNLSLFDTEYNNDQNNIFFLRNTGTYKLTDWLNFNAAFGIKNPGHFITTSLQYSLSKKGLKSNYSIGATYQEGFSLEQAMSINYTSAFSERLRTYFKFLIIANIDKNGYQRGIQQIRLGLKNVNTAYGLGFNFDQFNKSTKTLFNMGLFINTKF